MASSYGDGCAEFYDDRFAAKDGASQLRAIEGDFSKIYLDQKFDLVFIIANTLFLIHTEEAILQCFRNVRRMLKVDGVFLVETYRPSDLTA